MKLIEFEKCFKASIQERKHNVLTAKHILKLAEERWITENKTELPYKELKL